MRRDAPESIEELSKCNVTVECPHCGHTVALLPQHKPIRHFEDYCYFGALCPNHHRAHCKPIFAVYQPLNDRIVERYPFSSLQAGQLHAAIPDTIRADYAEGKRCMYAEAYKGAVTLFRRVVEAVASEKLGDKAKQNDGKTKRLYQLIDLMHSEGMITSDLRDTAHEVRHFGNYGAHIQDDGLDSVSADDANDVREVTWRILNAVYVAPYQTRQLRAKRQAR